MPPALDRSTAGQSASSAASPGRRLFSKIASPFASKSRNAIDHHIELADPHRSYCQGETVHGHVKLRISKPTRLTHLVVCLHGYAQVYKNPGSPPSEGFRAGNAYQGRRGGRSGEYFGNGFASLFEDESVLCGDGRLAEGVYQFNFELDFPDRAIPSSISFERGTVAYVVTSTLTRPTAISPTMTTDHPVYFVERIDVAQIFPPKARTITLEGLSRRARAKTQARKFVDQTDRSHRGPNDSTRQSDTATRRDSRSSSTPSVQIDNRAPRSPSPSEISFDSLASGRRPASPMESSGITSRLSEMSQLNNSRASLSKKITTTIESLRGGCLRGDYVSVKVNINHTKYVKSMYGIIVTLWRQARVDMHPAIPLGPIEKGNEGKYEDYYPKSLTGLGGLSLSGAGSSHVFRKDLSQVLSPLIVDPMTLSAEVNAKVQVPDEAFPTIATVPGAMISFKYFVEVIVDIQGKLGSQRNLAGGMGATGATNTPGIMVGEPGARSTQPIQHYGGPVIDTAPIRRDKAVVSVTFDVVVGTRDTSRKKGKRKVTISDVEDDSSSNAQTPQQTPHHLPAPSPSNPPASPGAQDYYYHHHPPPNHQDEWYDLGHVQSGSYDDDEAPYYYDSQPSPYPASNNHQPVELLPIPQLEDESQLPEKERLRRAEARLLPSAPPGIDDSDSLPAGSSGNAQPSSSSSSAAAAYANHQSNHTTNGFYPSAPYDLDPTIQDATAPYIPEEDELNGYADSALVGPSTPRAVHRQLPETALPMPPATSTHASSNGGSQGDRDISAGHAAGLVTTSNLSSTTGDGEEATPSTPTLDGLYARRDERDSHADADASADLPRYER